MWLLLLLLFASVPEQKLYNNSALRYEVAAIKVENMFLKTK